MAKHWEIRAGYISACSYCGEQVANTQKYCSICKTKAGRQSILDQNVEILKELRAKGYCKNQVMLPAV